jgi:hypothetical protein
MPMPTVDATEIIAMAAAERCLPRTGVATAR